MSNHIFGSRDTLQFEVGPINPESNAMRCVDVYALGLHLTDGDNEVYVPNFLFRLNRALTSFRKGVRFEQRPDVFGDLGPKDIHLVFADGSDKFPDTREFSSLYSFLEFGDITLHVLSYLIPAQGRLYLTCEIGSGQNADMPREIRVAEVSRETLSDAMEATLALVASEYDGNKSFLS
ncbi:hypothetical protein EH244_10490 [Variovorax beijingensis]|uniref:Uncharacterized protein n=1 Tax=Variovorax beijingensis TaxID=2496117 RepID=A0A3P3ESI6_9BURK|nr:hypothetical protein [Variovorax beijingensis]RRH88976.1 hypothetical protein EH244_10490 [Variovorax beijingensis]RSZ36280.1 hypothetical protein EJO66_13515 [Variovorax beijingensis]